MKIHTLAARKLKFKIFKITIAPIRNPWMVFSPDGGIHSEATFADAIVRMNLLAGREAA